MRTVLVTGPIGSGKSEACRHLQERGFAVYDCDSRTKMLYSLVPGLKCDIECALGIRWSEIGVIFTDAEKRGRLESMVFPYLVEDIKAWKAAQSGNLCFIESAIMLSKPVFDGLYDEVLLVTAPAALRMARNPKAAQRDALQSFDEGRITMTVENDGGVDELYARLDSLFPVPADEDEI